MTVEISSWTCGACHAFWRASDGGSPKHTPGCRLDEIVLKPTDLLTPEERALVERERETRHRGNIPARMANLLAIIDRLAPPVKP